MKEYPILFSTEMVQAILAGRKSMTRRILKLAKNIDNPEFGYTVFTPDRSISVRGNHGGIFGESFIKCPYGKKGDILWCRETFQYTDSSINIQPGYVYKATDPDWDTMEGWKWKPNIFMPKEACRIFLEITDIKVERLQDISEEDAIAEGIESREQINPEYGSKEIFYKHYLKQKYVPSAINSYQTLWQSINGEASWKENPFVWVISFKRKS